MGSQNSFQGLNNETGSFYSGSSGAHPMGSVTSGGPAPAILEQMKQLEMLSQRQGGQLTQE